MQMQSMDAHAWTLAGLSAPPSLSPLLPLHSPAAINNSVGAKTLLSSFTTGILLMITLLVLTPVFKNMSQNVQVGHILSHSTASGFWYIGRANIWLLPTHADQWLMGGPVGQGPGLTICAPTAPSLCRRVLLS